MPGSRFPSYRCLDLRLALALAITLLGMPSAWAADEIPPFKLGLSYQAVATGFELTPRSGGERLKFRPATSNYAGVIAGYRWLSGTVSFAVPANRETRAREGESWYQDYRLTYYWRRLGFELGYNRFRGYVIDNRDLLRRPGTSTEGFGASMFYVFRAEPFSLAAALDQTDVQKSSGGSFIAMVTFRSQTIGDTEPIIPSGEQARFGLDGSMIRLSTLSFAAGGGYAHHFNIAGGWFAAPLASLTAGYQSTSVGFLPALAALNVRASAPAVNAHIRISLGYNRPRYFLTLSGYVDSYTHFTRSIEVGNQIYGVMLATAWRFGA